MKRLCMGLVLLSAMGSATAQLGSISNSPACCQLTTSLIQDVVYGQDTSGDERFLLGEGAPPNIHFLFDTSGSMRELPQVINSDHVEFELLTTNGCENPRLDAFQASRGWDPNTVYPPPDPVFPNLFQDGTSYAYMSWQDQVSPTPTWPSLSGACMGLVPGGATQNPGEFSRCMMCLHTKGYYEAPQSEQDPSNPVNTAFVFSGRFLNFNPPKYVAAKAALKSVLGELRGVRVSLSYFQDALPYSRMALPFDRALPSCSELSSNPDDVIQAGHYLAAIDGLSFTTATPLARALLNVGYYFTSDKSVYETDFNFGTGYIYPTDFKNEELSSDDRSVCWGCQTSSVIIITDSEPTGDDFTGQYGMLPARLRVLNGGPVYCPSSVPCGPINRRDHGTSGTTPDVSYVNDHPGYYLDDVARLLFTQDLQRSTPPVVGSFDTRGKQNLRIHTIGFGLNSNLLKNTALAGGGQYSTAEDGASLKKALVDIVNTRSVAQPGMVLFAPASVDRNPVNGMASALIPRFQVSSSGTGPWQGFLYRFNLAQERFMGCDPLDPAAGGDLNIDGDCDDTHLVDADGDVVVEGPGGAFVKSSSPSTPAHPFWEAGQQLKPSSLSSSRWQARRIFTIIDTNADGKIDRLDSPVAFHESNAALLREYLGISQNPAGCADLAARIGVTALTPDECARLVIRWYRGADALNPEQARRNYDRPFLLHDIFHSSPISVEPPRPRSSCGLSPQCLPSLFSGQTELEGGYTVPDLPTEVDAYDKYVREAGDRGKIVLVGSNGGMLHAFDNGRTIGVDPATGQYVHDSGEGRELWAFIPPDVLPRLRPNIDKHGYFVDATPMVREVWLDGTDGQPADGRKQWQEYRTVAVVGSGRGSVHRFALDLTRLLGLETMHTWYRHPDQPGDFLWMWPQPCDPLALKVGESFNHFEPQPPPIGPVALTPGADGALRTLLGQSSSGVATPWVISSMPARERWVVALNGGYDPHQTRGRGMALVDVASGHTVWSFFHEDGKALSQHLGYSFSAGLSLVDVGNSHQSGTDTDHLLDTATVGDYGGQLWTVRFWLPGQWNASTQQVDNWFAARSFRVENLANRTTHSEALRGPFTTVATNVLQPTGFLRTFIGTGDTRNLLDVGTQCRPGNPRACAEQGCEVLSTLDVYQGGAPASSSTIRYTDYALQLADSHQSISGPACADIYVRLSSGYFGQNNCMANFFRETEATCSGTPATWSCGTVTNSGRPSILQSTAPHPHRFYGVWSYGGHPYRVFNTANEAQIFDSGLFTDVHLTDVGQFDPSGNVVPPETAASPFGRGWYLPYGGPNERSASAATVIDGCVLWNSFQPAVSTGMCPSAGGNTARLYQADLLTGKASCAQGFYKPDSNAWTRFLPILTHTSLPSPTPQRLELNGEVHTRATLGTPLGSILEGGQAGTPFLSLPVGVSTP